VGQKVNPIGFRVGVYRDWDSSWFARGKSYSKMLLEDVKIRRYLEKALVRAEVSKIQIEKTGDSVKVIIHTSKPGIVIGKKGQEIDSIRKKLSSLLGINSIEVSVQEVKRPELDAMLVAKNIANQLERRAHFKKVTKRATATTIKSGAKGIKICTSGRLGGAEIARSEWARAGSVPLHTLRSDIDYALAEAKTKYGIIGVKVWICRGEYQLRKRV
jgi:small subunit ribosomal protein S3